MRGLSIALVLGLLGFASTSTAMLPPTKDEAWVCLVEGVVEELSELKETIHRKPDNVNYAPEKKIEAGYVMVRLKIRGTAPNPQSRRPLSDCPLVQKGWSQPIALCDWKIIPLGTVINARYTQWNHSDVAGPYCLALEAR